MLHKCLQTSKLQSGLVRYATPRYSIELQLRLFMSDCLTLFTSFLFLVHVHTCM